MKRRQVIHWDGQEASSGVETKMRVLAQIEEGGGMMRPTQILLGLKTMNYGHLKTISAELESHGLINIYEDRFGVQHRAFWKLTRKGRSVVKLWRRLIHEMASTSDLPKREVRDRLQGLEGSR